jgi:hypothetical protein
MVFSYFKKKSSIKELSNVKSIWSLSPEKFQKQIEINFKDYKIPPIKITNNCLVKKTSKVQLTLPQQFISKYFTPQNINGLLIYASIGSGKCHGIDTPIIMHDGNIKKVQDIKIGDYIMGDDSKKRKVLSLVRGEDEMYEIIPVKGDKFIVNQEHILCLKVSGHPTLKQTAAKSYYVEYVENNEFKTKNLKDKKEQAEIFYKNQKKIEQIIEISVKDYLKLSNHRKQILKIYKVPINFPLIKIPLDPYMLGFWLGDGSKHGAQITTQDTKVLFYFRKHLKDLNLMLSYSDMYDYGISSNRTPILKETCNECNKKLIKKNRKYYFCNNECSINYKKGIFRKTLQELNLIKNKHIPDIYKFNSRENRLKLLAGLIDSDGHLKANQGFEFTQKNEKLMDDIVYLCRSLGFSCYKTIKKTSWTYKGVKKYGTAFRIHINGEGIEEIPTLCDRKKAQPRKQVKNVLVTGIKVKHIGKGKYYGFNLDGNKRYLLGDFTVTHNSLTSINLLKHFEREGFNFLFITRTTLKKDLDKAIEMVPLKRPLPRFSYKQFSNICKRKGENYRILLDKAKKLNPSTEDPFYKTIIVIDEAHKLYTKDLKTQELHDIKVIEKMIHNSYSVSKENRLRLVLMSATPITENPIEIIQLFNLLIVNPKERFDTPNFEDNFLNLQGKFTEKGLKEFNEKTKGLISYLNTSKDPSNFASMSLTTVYTPISDKPNLIVTVKDCQKEYKECKKFSKNHLSKNLKEFYTNVKCDTDFDECKSNLKDNRQFLKKTKFQLGMLKEKCNIHIE